MVAVVNMASSLSIRAIRSIDLFCNISSSICIDSVKLGGSELKRGENVPESELSDGTESKLGKKSFSFGSASSSESL